MTEFLAEVRKAMGALNKILLIEYQFDWAVLSPIYEYFESTMSIKF